MIVIACPGPSLTAWLSLGVTWAHVAVTRAANLIDHDWLASVDAPLAYKNFPRIGTITKGEHADQHLKRRPYQAIVEADAIPHANGDYLYFSSQTAIYWAVQRGTRRILIIGMDWEGDAYATGETGAEEIAPRMLAENKNRWEYERDLIGSAMRYALLRNVAVIRLRLPDDDVRLTCEVLGSQEAK